MSAEVNEEWLQHDFCLIGLEGSQAMIAWGPFTERQAPDPTLPSFYVQDFYLSRPRPWLTTPHCKLISLEALRSLGAPCRVPTLEQPNFRDYADLFELHMNSLRCGRHEKVVPVVFERGSANSLASAALIARIAAAPGNLHPYAFRRAEDLVVGASPEVLFRKDQESARIYCDAVAGTTTAQDWEMLQRDPHLVREQQLVIDDLVLQLSSFGLPNVSSQTFQPCPGLMHLRSEITIEISPSLSADTLIRTLHPTGALGVLPRVSISDPILRTLDAAGIRAYFGAPFGIVLPNGYWKFIVAIRSVMALGDEVLIGAGSGLLSTSSLANEWTELEAKRTSVKRMFFQ